MCERRGGRPGLPVPNIPYGLCMWFRFNVALRPQRPYGLEPRTSTSAFTQLLSSEPARGQKATLKKTSRESTAWVLRGHGQASNIA